MGLFLFRVGTAGGIRTLSGGGQVTGSMRNWRLGEHYPMVRSDGKGTGNNGNRRITQYQSAKGLVFPNDLDDKSHVAAHMVRTTH
jgi:hypothetical protein